MPPRMPPGADKAETVCHSAGAAHLLEVAAGGKLPTRIQLLLSQRRRQPWFHSASRVTDCDAMKVPLPELPSCSPLTTAALFDQSRV